MKFKVHDRVELRKSSQFVDGTSIIDGSINPLNCRGTITCIEEYPVLPIKVDWDNKSHNSYNAKDLKIVRILSNQDKFVPQKLIDADRKLRKDMAEGSCLQMGKLLKKKTTTLPVDSAERKNFPIHEGCIKYFPAALAGVAHISKIGNDKHNPGEPMHHSREKSKDHADCIQRHQLELSEDFGKGVGRDEKGVPQVLYTAWRALAQAQIWLEQHDGAPLAPNAKVAETKPQCTCGDPDAGMCDDMRPLLNPGMNNGDTGNEEGPHCCDTPDAGMCDGKRPEKEQMYTVDNIAECHKSCGSKKS